MHYYLSATCENEKELADKVNMEQFTYSSDHTEKASSSL